MASVRSSIWATMAANSSLAKCSRLASNSGLGYTILKAQHFFKTDAIFSGILVIGFLGLITDRFFALLIKRMFPWDERSNP